MPDLWYPGAQRFQGAHANYEAGRISNLTTLLAHYTVGRNSIGTCGRDFQILADRDGTLHQGAPVDAVCWGAGDPWNHCALHVEIEYLPGEDDEIFTPATRKSVSGLLHWARDEHGIPLDYWHGARIAKWRGTIAHGSVLQTGDLHSDYWPQEDWDAMTGDDMGWDLTDYAWVKNHVTGLGIDGQTEITNRMVLDAVLSIGSIAGPGGITADQVRAIVKEEINKTKLSS